MGMTYFKRYRMEFDLRDWRAREIVLPPGYELLPFQESLIRDHAVAKHNSFREELDADVFPCLSRRDGCLRLMREISHRGDFVPGATWLIRHREIYQGKPQTLPVGTIQGLAIDGWGSIQNLGIDPAHRGKGLGSILLSQAAVGFSAAGLEKMHLEVTTENTGAIRLYERLGFRRARVVYKAAEVAGAES
jgi:ribosomal protein S18 acetylase RimI-like enzyme